MYHLISANVFFMSGFAGSNQITQSPIIMIPLKESATLSCTHTYSPTYNRMYWFQQHNGKTMELIVYTSSFGTKEFENVTENKYSVLHETHDKGFLTVHNLESRDGAMYLCAVSEHSAAESFHRCTKTLFFIWP